MWQRSSDIRTERESSTRVHDIRSGSPGVSGRSLEETSSRLLLIMFPTIVITEPTMMTSITI